MLALIYPQPFQDDACRVEKQRHQAVALDELYEEGGRKAKCYDHDNNQYIPLKYDCHDCREAVGEGALYELIHQKT